MLPPKTMIASGALLAASLIAASAAQAQTIWYVNDDGGADNDCTSWEYACPELQTALSLAVAGDQIWVAEGTYRPDYDVKTSQHTDDWLADFARGVGALPEVVEFYRMSGDVDYLLKIVVRDIEDYDRVYKKLIAVAPLHDVSSSFAMERIKSSTALPLHHLT